MRDMHDLDNLIDNFDIHSFWRKKKIGVIFAAYLVTTAGLGALLMKAVMDSSDAGAVPKGMAPDYPGSPIIVR